MTNLRTALTAAVAATVLSTSATAENPAPVTPVQMRVSADQSVLLHLDRPAKTVIVGNSSIAEAQLVNDHTIYVLGRIFGNTNIIAIDAQGGEVSNTRITVGAPEFQQVTIYRGPAGQRNLACAPQCERTVMTGDAEMQAIYEDANKKTDISAKGATLTAGK